MSNEMDQHPEVVEIARRMFKAYSKSAGNKTHDGKDIPDWANLGPSVQKHWYQAAVAGRRGHDDLDGRHGQDNRTQTQQQNDTARGLNADASVPNADQTGDMSSASENHAMPPPTAKLGQQTGMNQPATDAPSTVPDIVKTEQTRRATAQSTPPVKPR